MKINLCCGEDYREGYVNTDWVEIIHKKETKIKVDQNVNVLKKLPWDDDSVDEIIFRESLEHFNRWNGLKVMKEIYRVLKPEGTIDLSVPNSERQLRILLAMMRSTVTFDNFINAHTDFRLWKWHDDLMGGTHESDGLDGNSHKTLYSRSSLTSILTHIGFKIDSFVMDSSIYVGAHK